ncbi:MAG: helix-turn-helix transcriptional regulator [Lentihominibacter sp.]|nr:helix-turn-helix transcriptional regulator [Clostridiales bacterium]MDY2680925.1 helix-turn-helix transcriptional regulator [Lentihominibacter sp.]
MNSFSYHPCQPGYYQAGEKYQELNYSEDCRLGRIVCQMFEVTRPKEHQIRVIPDGCNDILISCDGGQINSWYSPSVTKSTNFHFQKAEWIFGVRFYPGADCSLLRERIPVSKTHPIEVRELLPDFDSLDDELKSSISFVRRHEIIEDYLRDRITPKNNTENILSCAVRLLIETNGVISIERLAKEVGYGTRYLRQLFTDYIGHSSKELANMIRMQKTLQCLLDNPDQKLSDIAIKYGFSDQSHMNREFKKYMGVTSRIIKERGQWNSILRAELNRIF